MALSNTQRFSGIVQNVMTDLPDAIAVAVVDVATGLAMASRSTVATFNPEAAAAHNAEVVKQKQRAIAALKLTGQALEEILITLTSQLHVIKVIDGGARFVYLAVNAKTTNLGIAREVLREHVDNAPAQPATARA